jgi:hypothetical protein
MAWPHSWMRRANQFRDWWTGDTWKTRMSKAMASSTMDTKIADVRNKAARGVCPEFTCGGAVTIEEGVEGPQGANHLKD